MENGKKNGSVVVKKNRVTVFETKWKEIEMNLKNWGDKPPVILEAAVAALGSGLTGASIYLVLEVLSRGICSAFPFLPPLTAVPVRRLIDPRFIGVLVGTNVGITCYMEKTRGKKDVQTRMTAGFGSGIMSSMVARHPPAFVVSNGVFLGLVEAALSKVDLKKAGEEGGVQYRMVLGLGFGALSSILRGDPPAYVILHGAIFALAGAAFFKATENMMKKEA